MTIPAACQNLANTLAQLQTKLQQIQQQLRTASIFQRAELLAQELETEQQIAGAQVSLNACIADPPYGTQAATLLGVTTSAHINDTNTDGSDKSLNLNVDVQSQSSDPVTIDWALTLVTGTNGYVVGQLNDIPDGSGGAGSFGGSAPVVQPGTVWNGGTAVWNFGGSSYAHVVHALRATGPVKSQAPPTQQEQTLLVQATPTYDATTTWAGIIKPPALPTASPPALPWQWPVAVGLMGPVDCFDITSIDATTQLPVTQRYVIVMGQAIALSGERFVVNSINVSLSAGTYNYFNQVPITVFDTSNPLYTRFYLCQPFSNNTFGFSQATLELDVAYQLNGVAGTTTRSETVNYVVGPRLRAPVDCPAGMLLHFGNAVGDTGFNGHNGAYTQRFAVDLVMADASGSFIHPGTTGSQNSDSYIWSLPILAMADGVVAAVYEASPDHAPGTANDPNPPNVIVLQHGAAYSLYAHVQQNSAAVAVGQHVKMGDKIGLVGDNNGSSGPHVHFMYFTFDSYGQLTLLPMRFFNLRASSGRYISDAPINNMNVASLTQWPDWP